jgi:hypothetical protein
MLGLRPTWPRTSAQWVSTVEAGVDGPVDGPVSDPAQRLHVGVGATSLTSTLERSRNSGSGGTKPGFT